MKVKLPPNLAGNYHALDWQQLTIGESRAEVYQSENLVLKVQAKTNRETPFDEKLKIEWLKGKISVPDIVEYEIDETFEYLLMTRLPGKDAAQTELKSDPKLLVNQLGRALRELHDGVNIANCPFDMRVGPKLEKAAYYLKTGLVSDASCATGDLLAELIRTAPEEDLVFTHGDYCLPNIIIDEERRCVSGFVDLGCAGIADRYIDLALGLRSIQYNLGGGHDDIFLKAYGYFATSDERKIEFYQKLDQF